MKFAHGVLAMTAAALVACGGGKPAQNGGNTAMASTDTAAATAAPAAATQGAMTMPDWMKVDSAAKTVTLDIEAGKTADNNHWNYNGYYAGKEATITVPEGYKITINFKNDDPAMAHSLGVDSLYTSFPPAFTNPTPIFPGAMTSNPTDMTKATQPGTTETIHFTASKAGNYALNCYIPGHALAGMWVHFDVSADGKAGVTTS